MTKQALLIVDHGSKRQAANDMLEDIIILIRQQRPELIVEGCHMELAPPDIAAGIAACVQQGVTHITVQPMMFSPGRHAHSDIPSLVNRAADLYPNIRITVSTHLGAHPKLADLLLEKAGL